jgi:hypothetical protein
MEVADASPRIPGMNGFDLTKAQEILGPGSRAR